MRCERRQEVFNCSPLKASVGYGDGKFEVLERVWAGQGRDCAAGVVVSGLRVRRGMQEPFRFDSRGMSWARPRAAQKPDGTTWGSIGASGEGKAPCRGWAAPGRYPKCQAVWGMPRCRRFPALLGCNNLLNEPIWFWGAMAGGSRRWLRGRRTPP